jgi:hypothetical protein
MRIFLTDIFIASVMTEAHLLKHLAPTDNDPVQTAMRTRHGWASVPSRPSGTCSTGLG